MFHEIRYELNGVEIDRNRMLEDNQYYYRTVSLTYGKALIKRNAKWNITLIIPEGYFKE